MPAQNIQIGIDLGTTNSEVAVNQKGAVEVVKNVWQDEYTPSVFGFDKAKNKIVGKKAFEKLFKDGSSEEEKNYKSEVKRLMGTSEDVEFPNGGAKLNAEEISSEILKSLREDVQRKYSDINLAAAVITVPAYFSTIQKEATKRAGNLAGFDHVVLLQEPISAAMSYGFSNNKDENVIVYDLGGGTFDVAVVSSKDGVLSVLTQNGDNFLGGKDIDNAIVDEAIVPKLRDKYPELDGINRSQKEYKAVFARLKYAAEKAKIELSQLEKTCLDIDITDKSLGVKENNIFLNFDLSRKDLESIVMPTIDKTIKLTNKVIKESGVKKETIKRIILVGGPTQMPIVKRSLDKSIGIEVDTSSDPLTAVARGAAIFGLSQKVPKEILEKNKTSNKDEITLDINYDGLTSDDEQLIVGTASTELEDGFTLQIQSESGYFNSPKIPINNGKFKATIQIEQNKNNLYWIYLFSSDGNQVKVSPESISVTHGLTVNSAQLSHSIGLAIRNGMDGNGEEMDIVFKKGDRLPLEKKRTYHTAQRLKKDDIANNLWIRLLEGESKNPSNNIFIADTGINGKDLPHDIPEGTEIDVTIKIDESNVLTAEWYISLIDKSGDFRATIMDESVKTDDLRKTLEQQRQRAAKVEGNCSDDEKEAIEDKISDITKSLANAETDEDAKRKANMGLRELGQGLEDLEKSKELPQLKAEFEEKIASTREMIHEVGLKESQKDDIDCLSDLEKQGREALEKKDRALLSRTLDQIFELAAKVLWSNPQMWVYKFNEMKEGKYEFSDPEEAKYYFEKGDKAIESGDVEGLKGCVMGLMGLMSVEDAETVNQRVSGIMR
jgi:molecular chaperone DnaK